MDRHPEKILLDGHKDLKPLTEDNIILNIKGENVEFTKAETFKLIGEAIATLEIHECN